ncbi:MAG: hypothetical protein AAFN74_26300, partial [Myxococcota bacterium]
MELSSVFTLMAIALTTSGAEVRPADIAVSPTGELTEDMWLAIRQAGGACPMPPPSSGWTLTPDMAPPFERVCEYRSARNSSSDPFSDLDDPGLLGLENAEVPNVRPQSSPPGLTPLAADLQQFL